MIRIKESTTFFSLTLGAFLSVILTTFVGRTGFAADSYEGENTLQAASNSGSSGMSGQESSRSELMDAKEAMDSISGLDELKPKAEAPTKNSSAKKARPAEAFVVGPDWEFDGFVAGGQDQNIKSMFAVNDLIYLNVGSSQGFASGERIGIYRRGDRIKDPQTSKSIGFEVRKIAVAEVSDRIEDSNCSVRILKSYEAVEIGDLVRKDN